MPDYFADDSLLPFPRRIAPRRFSDFCHGRFRTGTRPSCRVASRSSTARKCEQEASPFVLRIMSKESRPILSRPIVLYLPRGTILVVRFSGVRSRINSIWRPFCPLTTAFTVCCSMVLPGEVSGRAVTIAADATFYKKLRKWRILNTY